MEPCKIVFDALAWQEALPGARFKVVSNGQKQMRLLELSSVFIEPDWCEKGHVGFVLQGELEIDFDGKIIRYAEGTGIFIPKGTATKHKARSVTPTVRLFLAEDV